ncbi:putative N6-adenine methyltransferase-domain-containing protein [Calycina marina]|uniref:Protein-lysine N-methyltransferase EFM5 n=1 Tax=Calycina marina TaxID=1763456 RepID=A0A9P7Z5S0_9HELO|nr:putative N6-adenine methyltransferase-domain-containing protein [Calycina marina]
MSDSNSELELSTTTLSALKEFYADRDARQHKFEELKAVAEADADASVAKELSMDAFAEDWGESQFWYSDDTATMLAERLLEGNMDKGRTIAVMSAPSVFVQLKNLLNKSGKTEGEKPKLWLLEYDKRFEVFPEFVFYDFNEPCELPEKMKGSVDAMVVDPPFLSEDCQTKAAVTVRWLSRSWGTPTDSKLIVCTGERMKSLINKLYRPQGIATTDYLPIHSKGLSNEFFCYANFECELWKWKHIT